MASFSERYGYIKPSEAIIVECMPKEIANAIFNCFDNLKYDIDIPEIQREVCVHFFNKKGDGFSSRSYYDVINPFITNDKIEWYKK